MTGDAEWFALFVTISGKIAAAGGSPRPGEADAFGRRHRSDLFRYVGCRPAYEVDEAIRIGDNTVINAAEPAQRDR